MTCLNIEPVPFSLGPDWQAGGTTTPDGVTISTVKGNFPVLRVEKKNGNGENFDIPTGGSATFMTFGSPANFILVLITQPGEKSVLLADTTGASVESVQLTNGFYASSSTPRVETSHGNGNVFLLVTPRATGDTVAAIFRSDTGEAICSTSTNKSEAGISGEAIGSSPPVGTQPNILAIKDGGKIIASGALPIGECEVSGAGNFGSVAVGLVPAATAKEQFTIRNSGTDCLKVEPIKDVPPYSITATSKKLPFTLEPKEKITVDVLFAPTEVNKFNTNIPLTISPVVGDTVLKCKGEGRALSKQLSYAKSVNFDVVRVGESAKKTVKITNTGEADITVNVPPSSVGGFSWAAFNKVLKPKDSFDVEATFAPLSEGNKDAKLVFTSNATGNPHEVLLSGEGCIPNAKIVLPEVKPLSFGTVQRGFRTVKIIKVGNTGNDSTTFTASIVNDDKKLFGIQSPDGSITEPLKTYSHAVNPVNKCGANVVTGKGEEFFAVTFYASGEPGPVTAEMLFESSNISSPVTYQLSAEIVAPVSIDVELVLDRSASMFQISGERKKYETEISAGKLFVQLARVDVEDRIGVVGFNELPEVVSQITGITAYNQTEIANLINESTFEPDGDTSISGGILRAYKDMTVDNPRINIPPLLNKAMVVLTDGKDNTPYKDPDTGNIYTITGDKGTLPLPELGGIKIYAIGIGQEENIDRGQLEFMVTGRGGYYSTVQDFSGGQYFQLEKIFTQIYMQNVDMQPVSDPVYNIQPGETHVHQLDVLRGDTSAMIVLYDREGIRAPFYLESPSGETVDVTSVPPGYQLRSGVTPTARFIELQMPPNEPDRYAGSWKAIIKHDGKACYFPEIRSQIADIGIGNESGYGVGFQPKNCRENDEEIIYGIAFGVGSNFRMTPYVQPGIISMGESIRLTADITEFGLPVTNCKVTVEALAPDGKISNLTLYDDGMHSDNDVNDGCYANLFIDTFVGGSYQFTFRAEGKSRDDEPVFREAIRSKYVEGIVSIAPKDSPITGGKGKDCCWYMLILTIIIIVLLVIIIFILLYMLFKP